MKTHKTLITKVARALGDGSVISHTSTEENMLGQSGVHTFVDDVISIVLNSSNEAEAYKNLRRTLEQMNKEELITMIIGE